MWPLICSPHRCLWYQSALIIAWYDKRVKVKSQNWREMAEPNDKWYQRDSYAHLKCHARDGIVHMIIADRSSRQKSRKPAGQQNKKDGRCVLWAECRLDREKDRSMAWILTGVWQLNTRKIATGRINPVFFVKFYPYLYCICCIYVL